MRILSSLFAFGFFALPLAAQPIDQATAEKMLFSTKGYAIQLSSKLSERDQAIVTQLVPLMATQLRQPVRYYAAIAYSPSDGLLHESLQAAMNYHNAGASGRAAVAACNRLRSKGKPNCQVAAQIVPKGYTKRKLTLSVDATAAFFGQYKKSDGPKVFAISPKSGAFGVGALPKNAISACNQASKGMLDCRIVITDR